jgi:bifunctional DNA-binding transcriptional regulator/antitoxin component of YhaV-PrlF toxin-antitoxin module
LFVSDNPLYRIRTPGQSQVDKLGNSGYLRKTATKDNLTIKCDNDTIYTVIHITSNGIKMKNVIHTKLGEGRRVAIPADLCQRFGLEPGDPVVLESSEAGIVMRPLESVIREVQAFFSDIAPADGYLSDELIRERREEAERERRK